jgi:DNA invertase Pin-like site-specific DNA recombinase
VSAEPDRPRYVAAAAPTTPTTRRARMPGEPEPLDAEQLAALSRRAEADARARTRRGLEAARAQAEKDAEHHHAQWVGATRRLTKLLRLLGEEA